MQQDITCVFEGVGSIGAIYISNLKAAQNLVLLNSLNIKAIVTAVRGGRVSHDKNDISDHLYVPADDVEEYDLARHFEETYNFIELARKKTNVLVHCYAGISRSATIVVAYLIRKYNYSLERVITMVKRKRSKINPNRGFVEQLKKQAERIGTAVGQNQNSRPIQQLLRKSYSVERKRGFSSTGKAKLSARIQNKILTVTQEKQAEKEAKIVVDRINEENSPLIKLQKVTIDPLEQPINLVRAKSSRERPIQGQTHKQTQNSHHHVPKSTKSISDKLQKIEQLKSRVLQSQSRKKLTHKHSHSEYKQAPWAQSPKIELLCPSQDNLSSFLSAKLSSHYENSSSIYQACKSTFSPDKLRSGLGIKL